MALPLNQENHFARVVGEKRVTGLCELARLAIFALLLTAIVQFSACAGYVGAKNASATSTSSSSSSSSSSASSATPALQVNPTSVNFGPVVAGAMNTLPVILTNSGSGSLTVTQAAVSGSGFGISGPSLPMTLTAGQSANFSISFSSATIGAASGTLNVASSASGATLVLSANVSAATMQLSANPNPLNMGNIAIGGSQTQNVTLTNTGNSPVSISSVTSTGAGFSASGGNVVLAPNQSTTVSVTFSATSAGAATGNLMVASNAPSMQVGLSATGMTPSPHSVTLNWSPNGSQVLGYFVYRGDGSGSLTKLVAALTPGTTYQDTAVLAGQTYTYAVSAVDLSNLESALSVPTTVTIPTN